MNFENISASSLANDHVILEADKVLPIRVRKATTVIKTMKTVVATLDLTAWAMISYRGILLTISIRISLVYEVLAPFDLKELIQCRPCSRASRQQRKMR